MQADSPSPLAPVNGTLIPPTEKLKLAISNPQIAIVIQSALKITADDWTVVARAANQSLSVDNAEDAAWAVKSIQRWEHLSALAAEKTRATEAVQKGLADQKALQQEQAQLDSEKTALTAQITILQSEFTQQSLERAAEITAKTAQVNAPAMIKIPSPLSDAQQKKVMRLISAFAGLLVPIIAGHEKNSLDTLCIKERNQMACQAAASPASIASLIWVKALVLATVSVFCYIKKRSAERRLQLNTEITWLHDQQTSAAAAHQQDLRTANTSVANLQERINTVAAQSVQKLEQTKKAAEAQNGAQAQLDAAGRAIVQDIAGRQVENLRDELAENPSVKRLNRDVKTILDLFMLNMSFEPALQLQGPAANPQLAAPSDGKQD